MSCQVAGCKNESHEQLAFKSNIKETTIDLCPHCMALLRNVFSVIVNNAEPLDCTLDAFMEVLIACGRLDSDDYPSDDQ